MLEHWGRAPPEPVRLAAPARPVPRSPRGRQALGGAGALCQRAVISQRQRAQSMNLQGPPEPAWVAVLCCKKQSCPGPMFFQLCRHTEEPGVYCSAGHIFPCCGTEPISSGIVRGGGGSPQPACIQDAIKIALWFLPEWVLGRLGCVVPAVLLLRWHWPMGPCPAAGWVLGLSLVPSKCAGAHGTGAASTRRSSSRRNVSEGWLAAGSPSISLRWFQMSAWVGTAFASLAFGGASCAWAKVHFMLFTLV